MNALQKCRRAFSLVELLVVVAIISLLAALLFPAFLTARGAARQSVCASNLRQIGQGIVMYAQDYDGLYPYAADPVDLVRPDLFEVDYPQFAADLPRLPMLHDVLQPYLQSKQLFACPSDVGVTMDDFAGAQLDAFPTMHQKCGSSYSYRSEISASKSGEQTLLLTAQINVVFDTTGFWHGTLLPLAQRYNVLFADGHVKSCSRAQAAAAWATPLNAAATPDARF